MGNCLKTQLKGSVNNDALVKYGYIKVHVCNYKNEEMAPRVFTTNGRFEPYRFPEGSYIVGDGTFSTGKKIVESGDIALIPANAIFEVCIPKYDYITVPQDVSDYESKSEFVYNLNEMFFNDPSPIILPTSIISFYPTIDGHHYSGKFENVIPHLHPEISDLYVGDNNITFDINNPIFLQVGKMTTNFVFIGASKITGHIETFISSFMQSRKQEALATTSGTKRLAIYNSGITSTYFDPVLDASINIWFEGTNNIRITQDNKTVYYNIDTDTFSE